MIRFEVELAGEKHASLSLLRYGENALDCRPALKLVARDFRGLVREQFDTQGGFRSGGWAELAESTKRYKERRGLDPRILFATGDLYKSLTRPNAKGSRNTVRRDLLEAGTRIAYAVYHHSKKPRRQATRVGLLGAVSTGDRLPRRPLIVIQRDDVQRWAKTIQKHITSRREG